ncbi:Iron-sulfur cluster assembly accessory protein [Gammaproteobacteria bacterium]
MIHITEPASEQIRQAARTGGMENLALRLAVRQLPDGTLDYGMGFDDPKPDDAHIEVSGLTIIIAPQHQALLQDLVLDYVELSPGDFRFIFQNPNDPQHGVPTQP